MYTHMHHFNSIPFGDKSIPTSIIQRNITFQNSNTVRGQSNVKAQLLIAHHQIQLIALTKTFLLLSLVPT